MRRLGHFTPQNNFPAIYPDMWKLADVPIFKAGDKQSIKNYRPISFLPICGKVFEKINFNNLYNHLTTHHLITKNQSGFRPGDSTTNQLIDLANEIHHAFDSFEVRAIFLDISKAFKMRLNGISGHLLKLFQNYLNNRKQRVALNGFPADYSTIESGVPNALFLVPYYSSFTSMILREM